MYDDYLNWPSYKFGMRQEEIQTTLAKEFNSVTISIQDPRSFYLDVYDISRDSSSLEELRSRLAERKQQRLLEISDALQIISTELTSNRDFLTDKSWEPAVWFFRNRSCDAAVRFAASFIPDTYEFPIEDDIDLLVPEFTGPCPYENEEAADVSAQNYEHVKQPAEAAVPPAPANVADYDYQHEHTAWFQAKKDYVCNDVEQHSYTNSVFDASSKTEDSISDCHSPENGSEYTCYHVVDHEADEPPDSMMGIDSNESIDYHRHISHMSASANAPTSTSPACPPTSTAKPSTAHKKDKSEYCVADASSISLGLSSSIQGDDIQQAMHRSKVSAAMKGHRRHGTSSKAPPRSPSAPLRHDKNIRVRKRSRSC